MCHKPSKVLNSAAPLPAPSQGVNTSKAHQTRRKDVLEGKTGIATKKSEMNVKIEEHEQKIGQHWHEIWPELLYTASHWIRIYTPIIWTAYKYAEPWE